MADIKKAQKFIAYIKQWEGGLSKDRGDYAARFPVPDGSGYHTNKGVTWQTFAGSAAKAGYTATPELFYKMPDDIWTKIFKVTFWDSVGADNINSQAIAELLVDWVWGSGPGIANKFVQRYLNTKGHALVVDGDFGGLSRKALNDEIKKRGEKAVFEDIYKLRYDFLDNLGKNTYPQFRTGWLNRMKDFYNMTVNIIQENPGKTTILGLLLVSGAVYVAWKYGSLDIFGNGANHLKKITPLS